MINIDLNKVILVLVIIGIIYFAHKLLNNKQKCREYYIDKNEQFGKRIIDGFREYLTTDENGDCKKPKFQPNKWNIDGIQRFNNCYAYAFRAISPDYTSKPQPGDFAGIDSVNYDDYHCSNFSELIQKDYPDVLISSETEECPCGYYKIALFMDDSPPYKDYHFYRQDSDGTWSHKPGGTKAIRVDDSGNVIDNPSEANRNYEDSSKKYNYDKNCGFYCYPYKENDLLD